MGAAPAIVHLVGFPGAGKYTVAQAIVRAAAESGERYLLIDNHYTSNVIFGVMEVDGIVPLPRAVWDRVDEVREAVFKAIEQFSPPEWSFVFTNVLTMEEPRDPPAVHRLAALAAARGCPYVMVHLRCDEAELIRRVPNDDRRARMKWLDAEAVRRFMHGRTLLTIDGHAPFELDVTATSPDDTARRVLGHVAVLSR